MSDNDKHAPSRDDAQELNEDQLQSVSGGDVLLPTALQPRDYNPLPPTDDPKTIFGNI